MVEQWSRESLAALREAFARIYPTSADARRVAADASLDLARIAFDAKAINTWFAILEEAKLRNAIGALIAVARSDYPDDELLANAERGVLAPPIVGPEPRDWRGPTSPAILEKLMGSESTLVSVAFLEIGLQKAQSVAKVCLANGSAGTGFLGRDNLLITNHHVLPDADAAQRARVVFNYQRRADGRLADVDERGLLPNDFFRTSPEDDWTTVRVSGDPNTRWGELTLQRADVKTGDRVNIIQHPGGLDKRLSFSFNTVVFVGHHRLQYLTDTEPGSSGAPVFNRDWDVVAVHHSGGWLTEPGASRNRLHYRNEGVLIEAILTALPAA